MPTLVEPLRPDDAAGFRTLVEIYREAIEPSERKPVAAIAAYLQDARYAVLVAREGAGVIGFAIVFFPNGADFWLLDYMAVSQGVRSRGIGGVLFRAACDVARMRGADMPCVIEIDDPDAALSVTNKARERAAFYTRQGCRRLQGLSYILPLDVAGTPPPMQILVHGLAGEPTIPTPRVRAWLSAIYSQLYDRAPDDPRIDTMLADAGETVVIEAI